MSERAPCLTGLVAALTRLIHSIWLVSADLVITLAGFSSVVVRFKLRLHFFAAFLAVNQDMKLGKVTR